MSKPLASWGRALAVRAAQAVAILCLVYAAAGHAQFIDFACMPNNNLQIKDQGLVTMDPVVWAPGHSYTVTINGTYPIAVNCPNTRVSISAWEWPAYPNYYDTGAADSYINLSNLTWVSPIVTTFKVSVASDAPTGNVFFTLRGSSTYWDFWGVMIQPPPPPNQPSPPPPPACPTPALDPDNPVTPDAWFAGNTYSITVKGTGFTTPANATTNCPATTITVSVPNGIVTLTDVIVVDSTTITAVVAPDDDNPAEFAQVELWGPPEFDDDDDDQASTADAVATAFPVRSMFTGTPGPASGMVPEGQTPVPNLPQPVIKCSGASMMCNGNVISLIDGSPTPQKADVGQQIKLATTPTEADLQKLGVSFVPNSGNKGENWTLDGTIVGGFDVPQPPTSGTVSEADLTQAQLTSYWVYPAAESTPFKVTYQYCALIPKVGTRCSSTAKASFAVKGPKGGKMAFTPFSPGVSIANFDACVDPITKQEYPAGPYLYYARGVSGSQCAWNATQVGITFNSPTNYKDSNGGSFMLVQLISSDVVTGRSGSSGAGLDSGYPYGNPPSNDSPSMYVPATATFVSRQFTANMFLMWVSGKHDSIPVPLGHQTWGFYGTAACQESCNDAGNWQSKTIGKPGPIGTFVTSSASEDNIPGTNNTLVKGFPTWVRISK